jgi:hypothetical protein
VKVISMEGIMGWWWLLALGASCCSSHEAWIWNDLKVPLYRADTSNAIGRLASPDEPVRVLVPSLLFRSCRKFTESNATFRAPS